MPLYRLRTNFSRSGDGGADQVRSFVPDYSLSEARDLSTALELFAADVVARPIAGWTDLMVLFNAGKLEHRRLISIRSIPELRRIDVASDYVAIGAAITYSQVRAHSVLQSEYPLLCQAASWTGGIANQNRGTLGGNIANASPAADSAPVLLVYDAGLELISKAGIRRVPYRDFHLGYKRMRLERGELIARVLRPRFHGVRQQQGRKVGTRKAQAIAKVSFAALKDESGYRIALGSVAPIPLRLFKTEGLLNSGTLTRGLIIEASESLLKEISPISDIRSTRDYRARVSKNLLEAFLRDLL